MKDGVRSLPIPGRGSSQAVQLPPAPHAFSPLPARTSSPLAASLYQVTQFGPVWSHGSVAGGWAELGAEVAACTPRRVSPCSFAPRLSLL